MAELRVARVRPARGRTASAATFEEPAWMRYLLIAVGIGYLLLLVAIPVANVFAGALSDGLIKFARSLTHEDTLSAIRLSLLVTAITVPLNAIFGIAAAWAVTKFDFRGKALLITLIDVPLAVSPVVAGLVFVLIFGAQGYFGTWFIDHGFKVIFATPGIVLATIFVTFPLVARSLIPSMQEVGRDYEEAAISLGASGWQTFWYVTLPSMKWGLMYGVILCNSRAMGEFGAVSVLSGKITGQTDTLPLRIEKLDKAFDTTAAFAVATLLVLLALVTLGAKALVEWRTGERAEVKDE